MKILDSHNCPGVSRKGLEYICCQKNQKNISNKSGKQGGTHEAGGKPSGSLRVVGSGGLHLPQRPIGGERAGLRRFAGRAPPRPETCTFQIFAISPFDFRMMNNSRNGH